MIKEEIENYIKSGLSRNDICEKLGINIYKLKRILKKFSIRIIKEKFELTDKCKHCDNMVEYIHFERKDVYCGRSCANKREHSLETKEKIKKSVNSNIIKKEKFCLNCKKDITSSRKKQLYCSISCSGKHRWETDEGKENIRKMVEKSVNTQVRRSKNEILFFEKCSEYFNNVDNNKPIFNGWDADVIIHDHKLAVLWNGKWHYEKIREGHSLLQVQNRDRIKIKEIERYGYKPYVIKDMGRFSKEKVEMEFNSLIEKLKDL
jgi:hypothetical protein